MPTSFFDLPREVRDMIYDSVMEGMPAFPPLVAQSVQRGCRAGSPKGSKILRVSRRMRDEASLRYWAKIQLVVNSPKVVQRLKSGERSNELQKFCLKIGEENASRIRKVRPASLWS